MGLRPASDTKIAKESGGYVTMLKSRQRILISIFGIVSPAFAARRPHHHVYNAGFVWYNILPSEEDVNA